MKYNRDTSANSTWPTCVNTGYLKGAELSSYCLITKTTKAFWGGSQPYQHRDLWKESRADCKCNKKCQSSFLLGVIIVWIHMKQNRWQYWYKIKIPVKPPASLFLFSTVPFIVVIIPVSSTEFHSSMISPPFYFWMKSTSKGITSCTRVFTTAHLIRMLMKNVKKGKKRNSSMSLTFSMSESEITKRKLLCSVCSYFYAQKCHAYQG